MTEWLAPGTTLGALAAAAFLAATFVPLSSEVVLLAVLALHPDLYWPAIAVATVCNTLGGMTSYLLGRFFAARLPLSALERVREWGAPVLLLAWTPIVGDALCVAAGWLKINWMAAAAFQAAGRFARYWAVARGMALF